MSPASITSENEMATGFAVGSEIRTFTGRAGPESCSGIDSGPGAFCGFSAKQRRQRSARGGS
jgi:hypothetical protein